MRPHNTLLCRSRRPQAIITPERAIVLKNNRTEREVHRLIQGVSFSINKHAYDRAHRDPHDLAAPQLPAFELCVLEELLHQTLEFFNRKVRSFV